MAGKYHHEWEDVYWFPIENGEFYSIVMLVFREGKTKKLSIQGKKMNKLNTVNLLKQYLWITN